MSTKVLTTEDIEGNTDRFNLSVPELVQVALSRNEGVLTSTKSFRALTGKYTGRSPKDKFIVDEPSLREHIAWGDINQPISKEHFEGLYKKALEYIRERESFIFEGFVGADQNYRLPVRVINEYAWHNLFVHQLLIRPTKEELNTFDPQFTVIGVPGLKANPQKDGTNSETFIIVSFEKKVVLIGGTEYAGELKKSIFSVLNYILPFKNVFPMHCSANIGKEGDVALFFGLSGTGKTTLSADPQRFLVGDDEHGWSDKGVFNFEGGCYAKCIDLSKGKEPQIWDAIKFGSVLENVVVDPSTGEPDYTDSQHTENTRAAYPIDYIPGAVIPGVAGHPKAVIFLTADAFGVLPPIAKLTKEQAIEHFLLGYTSKLAGTERGITKPEVTFSACFGVPFLPLEPKVYAKMLGEKIERHGTPVYLINTGWSGGPYGVGKRINLSFTRAMVSAVINGSIEEGSYVSDPIFELSIPTAVEGVPSQILIPRETWQDKDAYDLKAQELAVKFAEKKKSLGL